MNYIQAGNEKQNACNVSPAGEPLAFTVAASEETDVLATYSNYGSCVDIIAPGSKITSTWLGSSTNTISGTSMAAPHVAGVFALVLSELNVRSADEAYNIVSAMTTQDQIKNLPPRTINSLLFNGIDRFVTTLSVRLVEEEESMEIV